MYHDIPETLYHDLPVGVKQMNLWIRVIAPNLISGSEKFKKCRKRLFADAMMSLVNFKKP